MEMIFENAARWGFIDLQASSSFTWNKKTMDINKLCFYGKDNFSFFLIAVQTN